MGAPETITRVVVNISRSETCTYMFEGTYDIEGATAAIESGEHDPWESKVHREDVDIVTLEVRQR